jgi:hypothetical protein
MAKKKEKKPEKVVTPLDRYKNLVQSEQNMKTQIEQMTQHLFMIKGGIVTLQEEHGFTQKDL